MSDLALISTVDSIPARILTGTTPALFAESPRAEKRFWEFFAATIRNKNTRQAYLSDCFRFADWCEAHGQKLNSVEPMVVATYVELLTQTYAPATAKQNLAAIRILFDWLVVGQIVPFNPASSVCGPKHVVKGGKTSVLTADEARSLIDAIDTDTLKMIKRRALAAGLHAEICNHTLRGTGITEYLRNGWEL